MINERNLKVRLALLAPAVLLLASCTALNKSGPQSSGITRDGPPSQSQLIAEDPSKIKPEPQVITEPKSRYGNPPSYEVFGKTYRVMDSAQGYSEEGIASWYGRKFHGRLTSNREVYDMFALSAAHKSLPLPSYVRVTRLDNGESIVLRVNDRGPFHPGRIIDLSWAAAKRLGITESGTAPVRVDALMPETQKQQASQKSQPELLAQGTYGEVIPPAKVAVAADGVVQAAPIARDLDFAHTPGEPGFTAEEKLLPVTTPKVITANPPAAALEKHWLQLGAFSEQSRAQALVKKLLEQNVEWPLFIEQSEKDKLWRVKLGPVLTSDLAEQYKQQLNAQGIAVHFVR